MQYQVGVPFFADLSLSAEQRHHEALVVLRQDAAAALRQIFRQLTKCGGERHVLSRALTQLFSDEANWCLDISCNQVSLLL